MKPNGTTARKSSTGFTRLDLLVLLTTLALLAAVIRPVLGNSRPSRSLVCMDNMRRLQSAWLLYAEDNEGKMAGNYHGVFRPGASGPERPWVTGWLDWTTISDNTNTLYLSDIRYSSLAPFLNRDATLYKCPADEYLSPAQVLRGWTARVRSYSMNTFVGEGNQASGPFDPSFPIVRRLTEFRNLSPRNTFVFIEEHPDSINDPALFVSMSTWQWIDWPAAYHDGACGFAFADGHVDLHPWINANKFLPVRFGFGFGQNVPSNDPDLGWVRAHAAAR